MKPATYNARRFPLAEPTKGAFSRLRNNTRPEGTSGWGRTIIIFVLPLVIIGAVIGASAGAALESNAYGSANPSNIAITWLISFVVYIVIGLTWALCVEFRITRYYFDVYDTNETLYEDANTAEGFDRLSTVYNAPPFQAYWMTTLSYFLKATADVFLVIVPSATWPYRPYSYSICAFRAMVLGGTIGGTVGFTLGSNVRRWPLELTFLAFGVTTLQTFVSCMTTLGISEALNITQSDPLMTVNSN